MWQQSASGRNQMEIFYYLVPVEIKAAKDSINASKIIPTMYGYKMNSTVFLQV